MIISLSKKYRIKTEPLNFILQERHFSKKTRKYSWVNIGYHNNIHQLSSHLLSIKVLHSGATSFKQLADRIDEFEESIIDILKNVPNIVLKYVPDNLVITSNGTVRYLKEDNNGKEQPEVRSKRKSK